MSAQVIDSGTFECTRCRVTMAAHDSAVCPGLVFTSPAFMAGALPDPPCSRCAKPLSQCFCGLPLGSGMGAASSYCLTCGNVLGACSCSVAAMYPSALDPMTLPLPATRTEDWKTKEMHVEWVLRNFSDGMLAFLYRTLREGRDWRNKSARDVDRMIEAEKK